MSGAFILPTVAVAQTSPLPQNFTVEGRLYDSTGAALNSNNVDLQLEVLVENSGTASECVVYRETHSAINVSSPGSAAAGVFSLRLGAGARDFPAAAPSLTTFFSPGTFSGDNLATNTSNCSVTASSGDHRFVRVKVHTASITGYETLSPDTRISPVPQALVADRAHSLDGLGTSSLVLYNTSGTKVLNQGNLENIFSTPNYTQLLVLLSGTSSQYMPASPTAPVNYNGQRLTNLASPSTSSDAATKGYVDGSIGGKTADVTGVGPAIGDGKTLVWDATANKWQTGTVLDSTKLPLSGGTMSGPITMAGFDLAATGHITMSPQKVLNLGTFTDVQETTLVASLTAANTGASWYNRDHSTFKVWDGTHAVQQTFLDAITGKLAASWFPTTTVTAGTYGTSSGKVPTFTVGADGRLTAAGEVTISGGTPSGAAGGDLTGTYPNPTLAANAVTNAKVNNGAISTGKLSSTGAAAGGQVLLTDIVDPNQVAYFSCAANEIMKWSVATGWTCATVASLSPVTSVAGKSGAVLLNAGDVTGLGQAALIDYGTSANQLVQLDGTGHILTGVLPSTVGKILAVDPGAYMLSVTTNGTATLSVDQGTIAGKVLALDGSARIPGVDGSLLTNVIAADTVKINSRSVASTLPAGGQFLGWNATGNFWEPMSAGGAGTVVSVTAGPGLSGGPITSSGSLWVDTGTIAGKIVQLNGAAQLPGVDGSLLSSINAVKLQGLPVSANAPTVNDILKWNGSGWLPQAAATGTVTLVSPGTGLTGGALTTAGTLNVDVGSTALKIVQLNASGQFPVIDGSLLTSITAAKLQGSPVSSVAPTANDVLKWNGSAWLPSAASVGTLTYLSTGTGLIGGPVISTGTIQVDAGVGANQIAQLNGSAQLALSGLTAAAPSYTFTGSTTTGLFSPGTTTLALATNGSERLRIDAAGNVGVGTTNPSATFHVGGTTPTAQVVGSSGATLNIKSSGSLGSVLNLSNSNAINIPAQISYAKGSAGGLAAANSILGQMNFLSSDSTFVYQGVATLQAGLLGTPTNASMPTYFSFYTTPVGSVVSAERLRIDGTGNIGIGTSTPLSGLDIATTGTGGSALIVPRDTLANRPSLGASVGGMIRYNTSLNLFEFYQNGAWVNYSTGTSFPLLALPGTAAPTTPSYSFSGNANTGMFSPAANKVALTVAGTTALTINPTGVILAGSTTPVNPNDRLEVSYSNNGDTNIAVYNPLSGTNSTANFVAYNDFGSEAMFGIGATGNTMYGGAGIQDRAYMYSSGSGISLLSDGTGDIRFMTTVSGTERMRIANNGKIGIGNTAPVATLDIAGTGTGTSTIIVPRATTAQRPSTAASLNGMMRYSIDRKAFEFFQDGNWAVYNTAPSGSVFFPLLASPGTAAPSAPTYSFTGDSSTGMFGFGGGTIGFANNGTTSVLITNVGSVGIGTTNPRGMLDVYGPILGKPAVTNAGSIIDFSTGNIQYTNNSCGAFSLYNLKDGASYSFIVKGSTASTCSFLSYSDSGSTVLTTHLPPDHASTISSKHTFYSLTVVGTDVYLAWTPGY